MTERWAAGVEQIFNTTIMGSTTVAVGSSEVRQNVTAYIVPADLGTLTSYLSSVLDVEPDDLAELESALKDDPHPATPDTFGPRVAAWIARMVKRPRQEPGRWVHRQRQN